MKNSLIWKSKLTVGVLLFSAGLAHSATVITSTTPVVITDGFLGVDFNINPSIDGTNDFNITVLDNGGDGASLVAFGLGSATIAVQPAVTTDALFLEAGDTVGSSNTFDGNIGDFAGAFLASEADGGSGDWAGGTTGFLGFDFEIDGETHFGFARVTWSPDTVGNSSSAVVDLIGFESIAGNPAVIPVPEPSTMFLSALAGIALLRRRRA